MPRSPCGTVFGGILPAAHPPIGVLGSWAREQHRLKGVLKGGKVNACDLSLTDRTAVLP